MCTVIKNMSCEVKLAYILIIILFVAIGIMCCGKRSEKIMAKWIDENPKAILDSVQKFVEKEQGRVQQQQAQAADTYIRDNMAVIADEANTGVLNPKGTKVIVEFYDYNCGYCKMAAKAIKDVASDKDVKVVFRDYPILSEMSLTAAQYSTAVAISEPKKFSEFHENLFNGNAQTLQGIKDALNKSGISVEKIEKVLKNRKADIDKRLNDNREIAASLKLGGTPAFIINGVLVPGYIDAEQIKGML
jgi:protein-disulfide isomerase